MTAIAEQLNVRMQAWPAATSAQVEKLVAEIIQFADEDALEFSRSREVEQEVLDLIDEPTTR